MADLPNGFRMDFSEHAGAVFYDKVFGVRNAGECAAVQVAAIGVLRGGWQARLDQDRPGAAAASAPPTADAAQALRRPPSPSRAAPPSTPKSNAKIAASKLSASKIGRAITKRTDRNSQPPTTSAATTTSAAATTPIAAAAAAENNTQRVP